MRPLPGQQHAPTQRSPLRQVTNIHTPTPSPSPPQESRFPVSNERTEPANVSTSATTTQDNDNVSVPLPGGPSVSVNEAGLLLRHARARFSASTPPSLGTSTSGAPSHSSTTDIDPYDFPLDVSDLLSTNELSSRLETSNTNSGSGPAMFTPGDTHNNPPAAQVHPFFRDSAITDPDSTPHNKANIMHARQASHCFSPRT